MNDLPMLARFNRWANNRIYDLCATLDDADYRADRGAFFGSIHHTLNHLLVVDRMWLARITDTPCAIRALDEMLYDDFASLREARRLEDEHLVEVTDSLDESRLAATLRYTFLDGEPAETPVHVILVTLFNHQTHHRGQVHCLLTQCGIRPRDMDIIDYLDEQ